MSLSALSTSDEQSLYAALELSKNSWLLAIQLPDRDNPSLHLIKGGDAEGLVAKLDAARDRVAKLRGGGRGVRSAMGRATTAFGWRGSSSNAVSTAWSWIRPACRSIVAPVG